MDPNVCSLSILGAVKPSKSKLSIQTADLKVYEAAVYHTLRETAFISFT
jgi:hypothetical protein